MKIAAITLLLLIMLTLAFALRSEVLGFDALCMTSYPVAISAPRPGATHVPSVSGCTQR